MASLLYINGHRLVMTCSACPEQYDVFLGTTDKKVGYLRLRHGRFRADVPGCGGETVYRSQPEGSDGVFASEEQRDTELRLAIEAIRQHYALLCNAEGKVGD